jgi:hypothetical protein
MIALTVTAQAFLFKFSLIPKNLLTANPLYRATSPDATASVSMSFLKNPF